MLSHRLVLVRDYFIRFSSCQQSRAKLLWKVTSFKHILLFILKIEHRAYCAGSESDKSEVKADWVFDWRQVKCKQALQIQCAGGIDHLVVSWMV